MGMFDSIGNFLGTSAGDAFKGITGLAGGAISGGLGLLGASQTNQTNIDLANQANAFAANQYATRYQTTVKDLEAAGLNPMLAYGQGAGSPPSAVGLPQQTNKYSSLVDNASKAIGAANTAIQTQLTDAQITESLSRTGVNDEERKLKSAQTALAILEAPNVSLRGKQMAQQMLLDAAKTSATNALEAATRLDTATRQPEYEKSKTGWGKYISPYIKDFSAGANSAVNAAYLLK